MMQVQRRILAGMLLFWIGTGHSTPLPPEPQDCQITGTQSRVDFGTQSRAGLTANSRGRLTPGQRNIHISVICRFPQSLLLSIAGTIHGQRFGWGDRADLRIQVRDAKLDNKSVLLSRIQGDSRIVSDGAQTLYLNPGDFFTPVSVSGQTAGKQLSFILTAEPELDEREVTFNRPYSGQSLVTLRLEE
ncbi:hypothetical protein [Enterobacter quasiroggenkampii]|uniref:hypothetical protein n=1 Tax=Enterobacter quasiroggenkampii TaxID=2497436 RepID=UPI0021D14798|nr:hypothetical protein [Enterobacter quasiroggenkampii]MCU6359041.1 hypothetical protein [Enterobacter quasiroggenkampii]